ncbi:GNAT family N-acetyltransferase [Nakamurella lactea]|uniref:GNAT family N-acetyltransferase n=1 Tax=Nakamurella lactea TaxID=459515 RepID=UPI0003FAA966|nr:GNAT family N-acetyltransferase [Nakamurella lactea]
MTVEVHRVGPAGSLAADSQFGVALTTLWHAVSQAGGAVGFAPPVERPAVAAKAAPVVDDLRSGRAQGIALIAGHDLVGFGRLTPGTGITAHTGSITLVMIDPTRQGSGLGALLMNELMTLAAELGLERVELSIRDGHRLDGFYRRHGFVEWGRRPGWVRVADGDDRDEIFLWADPRSAR